MVANTIIFAHSVNYSEYDVDQYAERSLASFSGVGGGGGRGERVPGTHCLRMCLYTTESDDDHVRMCTYVYW